MRDEFLNGEIFYSLKEGRVLAERWRVYFNTERPHFSLGYRPPAPAAWQTEDSQRCGKVELRRADISRRATLTISLVQIPGQATPW